MTRHGFVIRLVPVFILMAAAVPPAAWPDEPPAAARDTAGEEFVPSLDQLVCSHDRFRIASVRHGAVDVLTESDRDFKPVSNLDGRTLVFFRVVTYGDGTFETWKTAICVVNIDGSGFRQLTDGTHADYNPTFLRDGSNRIAFNRYNDTGRHDSQVFLTTPASRPGSEQRVSHPTESAYEWAYSSLKDGRLFVHRIQSAAKREVFLLTPNPGGMGTYERIEMPSNQYFHKACISPSETKITYMYDQDNNGATYNDVRIAWAKLDVPRLRVYDQVFITPDTPETIEEYPKWSPDETEVLYDSNQARGGGDVFQIYAHRIADGTERVLSPNQSRNFQFVCVLGLPK
jgi:Tol biopolymer transport system component